MASLITRFWRFLAIIHVILCPLSIALQCKSVSYTSSSSIKTTVPLDVCYSHQANAESATSFYYFCKEDNTPMIATYSNNDCSDSPISLSSLYEIYGMENVQSNCSQNIPCLHLTKTAFTKHESTKKCENSDQTSYTQTPYISGQCNKDTDGTGSFKWTCSQDSTAIYQSYSFSDSCQGFASSTIEYDDLSNIHCSNHIAMRIQCDIAGSLMETIDTNFVVDAENFLLFNEYGINIADNRDISWIESDDDTLPNVPAFGASFTYGLTEHMFIFGGYHFNPDLTSLAEQVPPSDVEYGNILISYNQRLENPPGDGDSNSGGGNVVVGNYSNSSIPGGTCCNCMMASNGTRGCPVDNICTSLVCSEDSYCCNNKWDSTCANDASKKCSQYIDNDNGTPAPTTDVDIYANYSDTCPHWLDGCSEDNQCEECYYLCEYCQNADDTFSGSICTENDCMSCSGKDYFLVSTKPDKGGYCQYDPGTPSPTTDYLFPEIYDWYDFSSYFEAEITENQMPKCTSQCHTIPLFDYGIEHYRKYNYFVDEADKIYTLSNFKCIYPTPSPTIAPTQGYKGCYPRGVCNAGYMDQTNGNSYYWSCGGACVGGKYRTTYNCKCACIPYSEDCQGISTFAPSPPTALPSSAPTFDMCYSHNDCDDPSKPFCYRQGGGPKRRLLDAYGICSSCVECHYCQDGVDGTCGTCELLDGYPTMTNGQKCVAPPTSQPTFSGNEAWLFEISLADLMNGDGTDNNKKYNLYDDLCYNSSGIQTDFETTGACLTWHPLDDTVYIITANGILLFNITSETTKWSSATFRDATDQNIDLYASRGCTIDHDRRYIWITDDNSMLFMYDIENDELIDVGSYNLQKYAISNATNGSQYTHIYNDTLYPRMVPLSWDFILISSWNKYHILKTSSYLSGIPTQTKYGDIVCSGYLSNNLHSASAPIYSNYRVISFGAFETTNDTLTSTCALDESTIDGSGECAKYTKPSNKISYFYWQKSWRLVLAPISKTVLFGDQFRIENRFVTSCDLSYYFDDDLYEIPLNLLNPIVIEIFITSQISIPSFMYLINGTFWQYDDGTHDTSHWGASVCYICDGPLEFERTDFDNEGQMLKECSFCADGIQTSITDKNDAGNVYNIDMQIVKYSGNLALELQTQFAQIKVDSCEPGYGIAAGSAVFDCNECPYNQFTLKSQLAPCIACEGVNSDGLLCTGGSKAIVTYNWWVSAWDQNENKLKDFYDVTWYESLDYASPDLVPTDDSIIVALCPPKYCCQTLSGCDFLQEYTHTQNESDAQISSLCASGRNGSVPLCGACLNGYAELLGTTSCSNTCGNEWILIIPFILVLTWIVAMFMVFIDSRPRVYFKKVESKKEINFIPLLKRDDTDGFQTIIFKPLLYYYQSLSPILNTRGVTLWLSPVLAFFNFNLDAAGNEGSGICWSSTLNANTEILLNCLVPMCLLFNIMTPILCVTKKGIAQVWCICCRRAKISPIPYYASSAFRVLLMIIGVVLTVCFKYITFTKIGDKQLMFYSADLNAFGPWWFIGFFGVIFVILIFGAIFFLIRQQTEEERFASHSNYRKFVKSFKREYWYWEFILFSRRFFIALFTSIQFVGGDYSNFIFVIILIVYFGLQIQFKPFAFTRVNRIETVCLLLLLAAVVSVYFVDIDSNNAYIATILSFCILIPMLIVAFYAMQIIRKRRLLNQLDHNNRQHTFHLNRGVNRMLQRTPKSFRDVVKQSSILTTDWESELGGMTPGSLQEQTTVDTNNSDEVENGTEIVMAGANIELQRMATPDGNLPTMNGNIPTKSFEEMAKEDEAVDDDDEDDVVEDLDDILSAVIDMEFDKNENENDEEEGNVDKYKETMHVPTSTIGVAANLTDDDEHEPTMSLPTSIIEVAANLSSDGDEEP